VTLELGFKYPLEFNLPEKKERTFQAAGKSRAAPLSNHDGRELALFHTSIYAPHTRVFLLVYETVNEGKIA